MADEIEIVRHFATLEEAERARQYLEDNDMQPIVTDESHTRYNGDGVYALQVLGSQIEKAEQLLDELPPVEEEEAIKTMEAWEEESEEVREKYEED